MNVAAFLDEPRDDRAPDNAKKPKKTKAEVALIHVNSAWSKGALKSSNPTAVVTVAGNALVTISRQSGEKHFDPFRLVRWARKREIDLPTDCIVEIAKREEGRGYLFNLDDRGELLSLTVEDRIEHRLWMIAADGETPRERYAAKLARQAARRVKDRERKAAARRAAGKKTREEIATSGVTALAKQHGVSRKTIYKWKQSGKLNVAQGNKRGACIIEDIPAEPTVTPLRHLPDTKLAEQLGVNRKTLQRWKKAGIFYQKIDELISRTRGDVAGASSPKGHVTPAVSKSIDTAASDVRSALKGPAPSHAFTPARVSHPERYSAVILPIAAALKADPIGRLLRVASSALRRHPIAANINVAHAALASTGRA